MKLDIQGRIGLCVTSGIGYDRRTDFSRGYGYGKFLEESEVKNSLEGLRAHLRERSYPEAFKHSSHVGIISSSSGISMEIEKLTFLGKCLYVRRNMKAMNLAYKTEAEKQGDEGFVLFKGFFKEKFGIGLSDILWNGILKENID